MTLRAEGRQDGEWPEDVLLFWGFYFLFFFLVEHNTMILKYIWTKRLRMTKAILKNKVGGPVLPDI